jgi:hypothetical protein
MSTNIVTDLDLVRVPKGVPRQYVIDAIAFSIEEGNALLKQSSSVRKASAAEFRSHASEFHHQESPITVLYDWDRLFSKVFNHDLETPYTIKENETELQFVYSVRDAALSCMLSDAAHYNTTAKAIQRDFKQMTHDDLIDYLVKTVIVQRTNAGLESADTDAMLLLGEILFNESSPYPIEDIPNFFRKYGYDIEREGLLVVEILAEVADQKYGDFYHSALLATNSATALADFMKHMPDHIAGKEDNHFMVAFEKTTYEAPIDGMEVILMGPDTVEFDTRDIVEPDYCRNPPEEMAYFGRPDTSMMNTSPIKQSLPKNKF